MDSDSCFCCRASLTPETERLLVAPLKVVMDHISEAFHQPRKLRAGGTGRVTERMVWGKEGLGSWVALLAEQVRCQRASVRESTIRVFAIYQSMVGLEDIQILS